MSQIIIVGDFNLPKMDWPSYVSPNEKCHSIFLNLVNELGLHQFVKEPTRNMNLLDLVFSNNSSLISDISVECPFSTSDHNTVQFSINTNKFNQCENKPESFYDFSNADFKSLELYLSKINWDFEFSCACTIEDYWSIFLRLFGTGINEFVPIRKKYYNKTSNHYPKYIKKILSRKVLLWKRWTNNKTIYNKSAYKQYARNCKLILSNYQSKIELNLVEGNNISKFYKYVNNKMNILNKQHHLIDKNNNNKVTSSNIEIANVFNNHFGSVFTDNNCYLPNIATYVNDPISIDTVHFSVESVYKTLMGINPSTSFGPDGLPNAILKKLARVLCFPLSYIFEASFTSNALPNQWRKAFVSPIFKNGATSDPNNYRPISLTCTCCRIMEKIINSHIVEYLNKYNIISPSQHGFLNKRSTCTNLLESTNDWSTALDNHLITDVIYIDFRKAFDSVSHSKLIFKLSLYNIRGNLLKWITAFLTDRSQQVKISSALSDPIRIVSGVPQGSVLGPTLFLLFINDLSSVVNNLECTIKLFADDLKLYSSYRDMNHSHDLTVALDRIIIWSDTWQLPIASKKCFAHRIALSLHSISFNYKLGDCILDWSSNPKDLGVIMDSRQNNKKHIARVIHVANTRAYLILKCFKTRNPIILVRAFTTYIRPIIEYCSPVWSPHQTMLIKSIENIQKRFTKKISNNSCLSYSSRLQLLGLDSLELRRLKHDLVICFKIMHNLVCIDKNLFFEINNNNYTRGHTFRIRKQRCQLDIRKYCFS